LFALVDVITAPRLIMGSVATLLTAAGVPLQWATLWVMLVFTGCAFGALDAAVRLGASLMHNIYFSQNGLPRFLAPDRFLAAFITVMAALLISNVDYWILWPLFGAASLGLCAVALLPVILWLHASGRRIWQALAAVAGVLAGLSLAGVSASIAAQLRPSVNNLLGNGMLFLQCVVAALLLGAMIHALTGIGRPPRELPPTRGRTLAD
jgi:carbon starvation protein CstA